MFKVSNGMRVSLISAVSIGLVLVLVLLVFVPSLSDLHFFSHSETKNQNRTQIILHIMKKTISALVLLSMAVVVALSLISFRRMRIFEVDAI